MPIFAAAGCIKAGFSYFPCPTSKLTQVLPFKRKTRNSELWSDQKNSVPSEGFLLYWRTSAMLAMHADRHVISAGLTTPPPLTAGKSQVQ